MTLFAIYLREKKTSYRKRNSFVKLSPLAQLEEFTIYNNISNSFMSKHVAETSSFQISLY